MEIERMEKGISLVQSVAEDLKQLGEKFSVILKIPNPKQQFYSSGYLIKKGPCMKVIMIVFVFFTFSSCWTKVKPVYPNNNYQRVWGNKPIYDVTANAKLISYHNTAEPVLMPGNIYVKDNFIYQLETGKGIHVIDSSIPSQAHRVGFITVNGSSQISIKNNLLYTNSYDDLVVIDISNLNSLTEVKRVPGAFPEGRFNYYYIEPVNLVIMNA